MAITVGAVFMALPATAFQAIPQLLVQVNTHDRHILAVGVRLHWSVVFQIFRWQSGGLRSDRVADRLDTLFQNPFWHL
jgi:hypothetical protein